MLLLSLVWLPALAGKNDRFPSDVPVVGEIARPESEIVVVRSPGPVADLPAPERAARAAALDRQLAETRERSLRAVLLEERGDLYAAAARDAILAAFAAYEEAMARREAPDLSAEEAASALQARAVDCYAEALGAVSGAAAARIGTSLAVTLSELQRNDEANSAWQAVLRADPLGASAAEAHLRLGEHAFASADLLSARRHYEAVLSLPPPPSPLASYASYKLAWVLYDLGEFAGAVERALALRDPDDPALIREARRDTVQFASRLPLDDALAAIARMCGSDGDCRTEAHQRLGALLAASGRTAEAARIPR